MITISRRLEFDAGHRVLGHEGKCKRLHGHRYVVEIEVSAISDLDQIGRVVDFGVIKAKVGTWIDELWDHNLLLNAEDPVFELLASSQDPVILGNKLPYIVKYGNPTAENLAHELFDVAKSLLEDDAIVVESVTVWETPNSKAIYRDD